MLRSMLSVTRQGLDRFYQIFTVSSEAFSFERLFVPFVLAETPDRCCRFVPVFAHQRTVEQ